MPEDSLDSKRNQDAPSELVERDSWLGLLRELVRISDRLENLLSGSEPKVSLQKRLLFFLYELDDALRAVPIESLQFHSLEQYVMTVMSVFTDHLGLGVADLQTVDYELASRTHAIGYALKKRILHPTLAAMVFVLIADRLKAHRTQVQSPRHRPFYLQTYLANGAPIGSVRVDFESESALCLAQTRFEIMPQSNWLELCTSEHSLSPLSFRDILSSYLLSWVAALNSLDSGLQGAKEAKITLWQELIRLNPQSPGLWSYLSEAYFEAGALENAKRAVQRYQAFSDTSVLNPALMQLLATKDQTQHKGNGLTFL